MVSLACKILSYVSEFLSLAYLVSGVSHFKAPVVNVIQEKGLNALGLYCPWLESSDYLSGSYIWYSASQLLIWGKFNLLNL